MSGGAICKCGRRDAWRVKTYRHNHSTFHGGFQFSVYSGMVCLACNHCWRSKGAYVEQLKLMTPGEREQWLRGDWKGAEDEQRERTRTTD